MDIFDEPSRKLIEFMTRYEQNKKTHVLSYAHRADQEYRFITLKNEALDGFFTAVEGTKVITSTDMAAVTEGFSGERELYEVKSGLPSLKMKITALETGGAVITGDFPRAFIGMDNYVIVKDKCIYVVSKTQMRDMELFWGFVSENDNAEVFISDDDLPLFTSEMLQIIKNYYDIDFDGFDESKYLPEAAEFKMYLDAPKKDIITCELYAFYGEEKKKYNVFAEREYAGTGRDEAAEMNAIVELKKIF